MAASPGKGFRGGYGVGGLGVGGGRGNGRRRRLPGDTEGTAAAVGYRRPRSPSSSTSSTVRCPGLPSPTPAEGSVAAGDTEGHGERPETEVARGHGSDGRGRGNGGCQGINGGCQGINGGCQGINGGCQGIRRDMGNGRKRRLPYFTLESFLHLLSIPPYLVAVGPERSEGPAPTRREIDPVSPCHRSLRCSWV